MKIQYKETPGYKFLMQHLENLHTKCEIYRLTAIKLYSNYINFMILQY